MARDRTREHKAKSVPLGTLRVSVVKGPDQGKTLVAESDRVAIGTAAGNDLVLSDDTVSRYHLELKAGLDRILVHDLGSTNGSFVGEAGIEKGSISPGALLTLGGTQIKVEHGEPAAIDVVDSDRLGRLRGRTAVMRRLMATVERVAKSGASVLVLGETGTGKEVVARAIHDASPRASHAFETVDCGTLLPTLIASELFGHEKGAFTGADQQHVGAFERAHGGTLFLDEIGEIPAALQAALLGALERRSFRRLGGQKPVEVDVRLIAATHRDLRSEVNAGTFRADLYYRIAVVLLELPALREHVDDIPLLAEHFLRESGYQGEVDAVLPAQAIDSFKKHYWPGNVRELRNVVEATLALGEAPRLHSHTPAGQTSGGGNDLVEAVLDKPYSDAKDELLRDFELRYLKHLMARVDGNLSAAAREAKMNRSYLLDVLKRHGLR